MGTTMFYYAKSFNQCLDWNMTNVQGATYMFDGSGGSLCTSLQTNKSILPLALGLGGVAILFLILFLLYHFKRRKNQNLEEDAGPIVQPSNNTETVRTVGTYVSKEEA